MKKIAIVYYSGTGNTEEMANAILEGVKEANGEASLFSVSDISAEEAKAYDVLVLGCPAMGDEVLEEEEFEPFFSELEGNLAGKDVALFGSYGWGDGQWMRDWQDRVVNAGATMVRDGIICNDAPDDEVTEDLKKLGQEVVAL